MMSCQPTVVIVDGESSMIQSALANCRYRTVTAHTVTEALPVICSHCPDVILLDPKLPDRDGLELIRVVRLRSQVPILVVSARDSEEDKVRAFDAGADDYIIKPFGAQEFLARIRAAIRHMRYAGTCDQGILHEGIQRIGRLTINYNLCRVLVDEADAGLTRIEYKIMEQLAKQVGRIVTYEYLRRTIWGPNTDADNRILRVNMTNIRKKIEKVSGRRPNIITEKSIGYRLEPETEA